MSLIPAAARLHRRGLLQLGAGSAGALGSVALGAAALPLLGDGPGSGGPARAQTEGNPLATDHLGHTDAMTVGDVDVARMGFDPSVLVRTFDYGEATTHGRRQTVREWEIAAYDKEIEIAPGVFFPAWTYNGQVPGPTLRANEGDRLRIHFTNAGTHPHTMHFHGIHSAVHGRRDRHRPRRHPAGRDLHLRVRRPSPFGCHLYHCHSTPLKRHIHKGLYGAFIVNPDPAKHGDDGQAAPPGLSRSRRSGRSS